MADFHQRLVPCLHFYYMLYLSRSLSETTSLPSQGKGKYAYTPSSLDPILLLELHWYVIVVVCLLCLIQG
uniref:Uncharacterized protein n=1 Tax=Solanum tuberosum TaxID=4113 RepID=M1B4L5_SOLTU